jgi:hypothetical protein
MGITNKTVQLIVPCLVGLSWQNASAQPLNYRETTIGADGAATSVAYARIGRQGSYVLEMEIGPKALFKNFGLSRVVPKLSPNIVIVEISDVLDREFVWRFRFDLAKSGPIQYLERQNIHYQIPFWVGDSALTFRNLKVKIIHRPDVYVQSNAPYAVQDWWVEQQDATTIDFRNSGPSPVPSPGGRSSKPFPKIRYS